MSSKGISSVLEGTFTKRLGRLARQLAGIYLMHQCWKAHEAIFAPSPSELTPASHELPAALGRRRYLRKLTGVRLSVQEAEAVWPRILEHKWYLGELLGRDVGIRVAAVDYFENVEPPARRRLRFRAEQQTLPPRLPMMTPFGERP